MPWRRASLGVVTSSLLVRLPVALSRLAGRRRQTRSSSSTRRPGPGHAMPEKEAQAAAFCGEAVIAEFESLTRDAAAVQRDTLRRILADNACAEYLRCRGLAGRTDAASFRACVPLATHADIEPYIARIADGDTSPVLTAKPITSISLRSVILDSTRSVHVGEPPCVTDRPLALLFPCHAAPARRRGSASTCPSTRSSSSPRCRYTGLPTPSGTGE
jgi:hypothetical protein